MRWFPQTAPTTTIIATTLNSFSDPTATTLYHIHLHNNCNNPYNIRPHENFHYLLYFQLQKLYIILTTKTTVTTATTPTTTIIATTLNTFSDTTTTAIHYMKMPQFLNKPYNCNSITPIPFYNCHHPYHIHPHNSCNFPYHIHHYNNCKNPFQTLKAQPYEI